MALIAAGIGPPDPSIARLIWMLRVTNLALAPAPMLQRSGRPCKVICSPDYQSRQEPPTYPTKGSVADSLQAGDHAARFPIGSLLPRLPFVSALLSEPLDRQSVAPALEIRLTTQLPAVAEPGLAR